MSYSHCTPRLSCITSHTHDFQVCIYMYCVCTSNSVLSPELHTHLYHCLLDIFTWMLYRHLRFYMLKGAMDFTLQTDLQFSPCHISSQLIMAHHSPSNSSQTSRNQFLPVTRPPVLFTPGSCPSYLQNASPVCLLFIASSSCAGILAPSSLYRGT